MVVNFLFSILAKPPRQYKYEGYFKILIDDERVGTSKMIPYKEPERRIIFAGTLHFITLLKSVRHPPRIKSGKDITHFQYLVDGKM